MYGTCVQGNVIRHTRRVYKITYGCYGDCDIIRNNLEFFNIFHLRVKRICDFCEEALTYSVLVFYRRNKTSHISGPVIRKHRILDSIKGLRINVLYTVYTAAMCIENA